jgi:hypothetical protein
MKDLQYHEETNQEGDLQENEGVNLQENEELKG